MSLFYYIFCFNMMIFGQMKISHIFLPTTFFCVEFVNIKVGWMLIENNDVSVMGGNYKKYPMNIILSPPNGNMLDFNFCNLKCIVASIVQPTIDKSSIIIN